MRPSLVVFAIAVVFESAQFVSAQCIASSEAGQHVGEIHCVSGKIYRVERLDHGVTLLNFCPESETCPFAAVVFARDLKRVGDVGQLQGKNIEVHGKVTEYKGRAEIIIERSRQLGGEGSQLPALPKEYDVEKKGRYSAGRFSLPRASHPRAKKKQPPALPAEIPDDPE